MFVDSQSGLQFDGWRERGHLVGLGTMDGVTCVQCAGPTARQSSMGVSVLDETQRVIGKRVYSSRS